MSKCILIVENDQSIRQILCEIAEGIGYQALSVDRAMEAWNVLQEQTISLILLDIKMPQVHGHQFLRFIRGKGKVIPVIVVSGYLRRDVLDEIVAEDQVAAVLAKPFTVRRVAQEISKALEGSQTLESSPVLAS